MAPLTWRNVDAPNFSGSASSLQLASNLFGNATQGLNDAIAAQQKRVSQGDSGQVIANALQYTSSGDLANALKNGTALAGMDPRNLTPAALDFLANRSKDLLYNEGTSLVNSGRGIANNQSQFNLDQAQAAAGRADAYRANQPAANDILTQARSLYDTGNADSIAQGRKLIMDNSNLFTKAGYGINDVLNIMQGNTGAANQGIQLGQNIANDKEFYRKRFEADGARGVLNTLVADPSVVDLPTAQAKLQQIPGLTADQVSSINKSLTDNKDSYFPAPNPIDTLPTSLQNPTTILQQYGGAPRQGGGNLPATFQAGLDRTEGGGNYDTLFGNAQNRGPFAGTSVSNMTVGQAIDFARNSGYGQMVSNQTGGPIATPMGRHQIVGSTLAAAAKEMGLDPNTPFDANTQDAVALHIAKKAISGPQTMEGKIAALRGQWEGFKNLSDAQVGQMVNEIQGTNDPVPSSPLSPTQIMRNSVVANGGYATGPNGTTVPAVASNILSNTIGGASNDAPVQVQVTQPTPQEPASTNQATNPTPSQNEAQTAAQANQDALAKLKTITTSSGGQAFIDTNGTIFQQTGPDSFTQVDATGIPTGGANYRPNVITNPPEQPVQGPVAPQPLSATQILSNAQTVNNAGVIDNLSNNLGSLEQQLVQRPNRGESVSDTVSRLKKGALSEVPQTAITDAINEIMRRNNVDADVAGILAQQSVESRDLSLSPLANLATLGLGNYLFAGDKYGRASEGRTGQRIDVNRATDLLSNFRAQGQGNNSGSVAPGVARLNAAQGQVIAQQQVQVLATQAAAVQDRVNRVSVALQRDPSNPQLQAMLQQAQAQLQMLNSQLIAVTGNGAVAPYTRNTNAAPQ